MLVAFRRHPVLLVAFGTTCALAIAVPLICAHRSTNNHLVSETDLEHLRKQIAELEQANIPEDVGKALAKQDRRLVGVMGVGPVIPGAPDLNRRHEYYRTVHGFRFIENTSDVVMSPEHGRLQSAGYSYAEQYNTILLVRVRTASRPATERAPVKMVP